MEIHLIEEILVYVGSKGVTRFFKLTRRAAVLLLHHDVIISLFLLHIVFTSFLLVCGAFAQS
jgi:hypothetical protein